MRTGERFAGFAVAIVATLVVVWGTKCGPVSAGDDPDALERWADRVAAASGLPAEARRETGGVVTLRLGASDGPAVAVLVDAESAADGGRKVEQIATRAARTGLDPRRAAILAVVLPEVSASAPRQLGASATFNFPWRWDEARRTHGALAGVIPGELPWVAGTSDALLRPRGIAGVVDARSRIDGADAAAASGPGTLRGLVEGRIGSPFVVDPGAEAVNGLLAQLPRLRIADEVWRRVGARTWVVDFAVDAAFDGDRSANPGAQSGQRDLRLELRTGDAGARLAAFAAADGPRSALELVPVDRGRPRIGGLPEGVTRRCRAVLVLPEGATGGPQLDVGLRSSELLGTSRRLSPPAPDGVGAAPAAPSAGPAR